jgi:CRISPR-associated protein Csm2
MNVQFKVNGVLDPELFSSKADECAKEVFSGQARSHGKANKPSQIRKFYDEVLKFDGMLKSLPAQRQEDEFNKLLPYLKMLNAKAAYAEGRELITREFKEFISECLKQINSKEDFEIFASFFEAFMGFYKYYDAKEMED